MTESSIPLLRKIARRDAAAFKEFYRQFAGFVFSIALRILQVRSEAEDLLQEIFFHVWEKADSYDPSRGTPEAWLSTLTRSRAIDKLRRLRRREGRDVSEQEEPAVQPAFQDAVAAREALKEVTPLQREVLELAYFEGHTQEEIAQKLKVPLGTIKTRIRDGLMKLRELYHNESRGGGRS